MRLVREVENSLDSAEAFVAIRVPRLVPSVFITQMTHCIRSSARMLDSRTLIWPLIAPLMVTFDASCGETTWRTKASTAPAGLLSAVATTRSSKPCAVGKPDLARAMIRRTMLPVTSHEPSGVGETVGAEMSK